MCIVNLNLYCVFVYSAIKSINRTFKINFPLAVSMKDIFFNLNDEFYLLKSPKKEEKSTKSLKSSVSGILGLRIPRFPDCRISRTLGFRSWGLRRIDFPEPWDPAGAPGNPRMNRIINLFNFFCFYSLMCIYITSKQDYWLDACIRTFTIRCLRKKPTRILYVIISTK